MSKYEIGEIEIKNYIEKLKFRIYLFVMSIDAEIEKICREAGETTFTEDAR